MGTTVTITGQNFTKKSRVSFNGTPAAVVSQTATEIVTTVPGGASDGHITVTTRAGTATSPKIFKVT